MEANINGKYRVVYGSVCDQDTFGRAIWFREGWWWVCDHLDLDTGYPYDPEGPFQTKQAATRHLWETHRTRGGHVRGAFAWKQARPNRKRRSRLFVRHIMRRKYLARWERHVSDSVSAMAELIQAEHRIYSDARVRRIDPDMNEDF